MIDNLESVNWANVWWILGANYLIFEGVMGDFRKKISCRLISRGKKHAKKFLEKQNLNLIAFIISKETEASLLALAKSMY